MSTELVAIQFGGLLEIGPWDLMNDGTVDDEDGFANVVAMARHEGVNVDAVRAEVFKPELGADGDEPAATAEAATTNPAENNTTAGAVAVRYRNPSDPGQAWTGRGRQPKWVMDWVQSGKSLDALRVDMTLASSGQVKPAEAWPFPNTSSTSSTSQVP